MRDQDAVEIARRAAPKVRDQDAVEIARRAAPRVRDQDEVEIARAEQHASCVNEMRAGQATVA